MSKKKPIFRTALFWAKNRYRSFPMDNSGDNQKGGKESLYERFLNSIYAFHRPLYHSLSFLALPEGEQVAAPADFIENYSLLSIPDKEFLEHLFNKLRGSYSAASIRLDSKAGCTIK